MLFFRSEERVQEWCRDNEVPVRPILSLDQLWRLAVAWYDTRLTPDARRPQPDEMRRIFAEIGLEGPFWDPQSDRFG
jgi:Alkylmercury lyase